MQNETHKKAIAVPRRERISNQWDWIWKTRDSGDILPSSLEWVLRQRLRIADSGKNSHPLLASVSFPRIPSAGAQASEVQSRECSSGIYKNLARFSVNFNFSFSFAT